MELETAVSHRVGWESDSRWSGAESPLQLPTPLFLSCQPLEMAGEDPGPGQFISMTTASLKVFLR